MTYPDQPIMLDVDPSGYIQGLGAAEKATTSFGLSAGTAALALGPLRNAIGGLTPSKAVLAGMTALGAVSGRAEAQLSTLRATARTTGASYEVLTKGTRQLAKELPISNSAARDLVTQMSKMGVATKGNEKSLIDLSKTMVKLSGATGEGPGGLAQGMIQLSRATNTGTAPKRMEALADSLTTVAAKSGSSATGILQFSKAISPMANASGIGTTKIMGISAAFSKMGEDGFGAANAFNKMLGDLNRSVREGSPEMSKYAKIVGTTAGEFEAMFKADPTEAITQVTEAIGAAGENGPRMLESLGLEGVRTQRALQQLSAGGSLRTEVANATGGYGSGSTAAAAEASFGGLADSTQRLTNITEQAADALGTPFLGALAKTTDALGMAMGGFVKIVESSPVQRTLEELAKYMIPAMLAFKVIPTIINALGLSQLATSGPLRGFLAGLQNSGMVGGGIAGRLGGQRYNDVINSGRQPGSDRMAPINERAREFGTRLGQNLPQGGTGTGPPAWRMGFGALGLGAGMYLRVLSESARLSRSSFENRNDTAMRPYGAAAQNYVDQRKDLRWQLANNFIGQDQYKKAMADLRKETLGTARPIGMLTRGVLELGKQVAMSAPVVGARLAGGALGMVPRTVQALGGGLGAAMTVGMVGMQLRAKGDQETEKQREAMKNATSALDDYRVAVGGAVEATSTFTGAMGAANKANRDNPQTASEALRVTEEDFAASQRAGAAAGRVRDYTGSEESAMRQLRSQFGTSGIGAAEIQQVQMDLFNSGFDRRQVNEISAAIPTSGNSEQDMTGDVTGMVQDIGKLEGRGGFGGAAAKTQNVVEEAYGYLSTLWGGQPKDGYEGTAGSIEELSGEQKERAGQLVTDTFTRYEQRSEQTSPEYARKMQLEEIDKAVEQAFAQGDTDLAETLMNQYQNSKGSGVSKGNQDLKLSRAEVEDAGGYAAALADRDKAFRQGTYRPSSGAEAAAPDSGWVAQNIGRSNPLFKLFDELGKGTANRDVAKLLDDPENPRLQQRALQSTIREQQAAGTSMIALSKQASDAANKLGDLDDATIAFLNALRDAARFAVSAGAAFASSSETRQARATLAAQDVNTKARTPEALRRAEQGKVDLLAIRDEIMAEGEARVSAYREQQIAQTRQLSDYNRQREHMITDYGTQVTRQRKEHEIGLTRMEAGHLRQRARALHDYNRGVRVGTRDFNKQMARMAEDGARAMYAPYERIQVQPIWDTPNLAGNLKEQNEAIKKQLSDLDALRKGGGTDSMIALLGLNDPKNAQQLSEIIASMRSDPKVVAELNKMAEDRMRLGGNLAKDKANPNVARANEDFRQGLADNKEQYDETLKRADEDYATTLQHMNENLTRALALGVEDQQRSLNRMAEAQAITVARMGEDITRMNEEIVTDLAGMSQLLTQVINGETLDLKNKTKSSLDGVLSDVELFRTDLEKLITSQGPGITVTLSAGMGVVPQSSRPAPLPAGSTATRPGPQAGGGGPVRGGGGSTGPMSPVSRIVSGSGKDDVTDGYGTGARGTTVSSRKGADVYAAYPGRIAQVDSGRDGRVQIVIDHGRGRATRYSKLKNADVTVGTRVSAGRDIGDSSGQVVFEALQGSKPINPTKAERDWKFALGGIATKPMRAEIAEAGSHEAVIPLNTQGVGALAKALRQFVGADDARALKASKGTTIITYDYSTHGVDHSTKITGPVTVVAQDPNEMARRLAAKQKTAALTAPPTRR